MAILASVLYDPAVAVTKSAAATIAMTALDTVNLRLSFTAPANGTVLVRMSGAIHGATTFPQILLGVLDGVTVRARVAPQAVIGGTAIATTIVAVEALFTVSGLTAGAALVWDAAYGVETLAAATGIKYGGPNNATANDAFGGFAFQIWGTA